MPEAFVLSGEPPVTVALRRSGRARRLSLRVSRLDGRVTLTLPPYACAHEARAFAEDKADWIRARLAEHEPTVRVAWGARIPVEGRLLEVAPGPRTRLVPEAGRLELGPSVRTVPGAVAGVLRARARDRLTAASDAHAAVLGRPYSRITLRDTRSRWGSCSAQGALMYSWRLILAPPDVLDYVAAHEVAHLAQMNHSPAFWAEVARLCPGYAGPRAWLRREGQSLHRYLFTAA